MKIEDIIGFVNANPNSAFFHTPSFYKEGKSYLFSSPKQIVTANHQSDLESALAEIDELLSTGLKCYGYINYETGYLLEEKLNKFYNADGKELLRFCFYNENEVTEFIDGDIDFSYEDQIDEFEISNFRLNTPKKKYVQAVQKIKDYIADGDSYQVNYTLKGKFDFTGGAGALFRSLLFNQSAGYAALINNEKELIISLSPELFFKTEAGRITALPMKGTEVRGINNDNDRIKAEQLKSSEKDRAENLMIVDLLRNDFGKIAKYGSVKVEELFRVEKYESLFQMTSEISAELREDISLSRILKNIFPCGSITGAPKIRTMQIIKELEIESRGIYTGAIGFADVKCSVFNVAIRTINLNRKTGKGELGLGSGIVWDSDPESEYDEILLKSRFLTEQMQPFKLFETARIESGQALLIDEHINRLKLAAEYFMFMFDENKIKNAVAKKVNDLETSKKYRMKLELDKYGKLEIICADFPEPVEKVKLKLSNVKVSSENKFLRFKTTNRGLYDLEYEKALEEEFFDVIFMNENEEITEGAISNIFIKKDGVFYTPPVSSGLLPGVYRQYFIDRHPGTIQKILKLSDLKSADEIILTNSLRGITSVSGLFLEDLGQTLFVSS